MPIKAVQSEWTATDMLRYDHDRIRALFARFELTNDPKTKKLVLDSALAELLLHSSIEEEIFYPLVRRKSGALDLIDEAEEQHHVAKLLISELAAMSPGDDRYEAKAAVLAESVRAHIEHEEAEIIPKAEKADLDLEALGRQIRRRRDELKRGLTRPKRIHRPMMGRPSRRRSRNRAAARRRG